ncbi:MAG: PIN domain-containing protein [Gammaproteobacteria bacterium]|nr:PIN domain-containing protein [Gammaproteobacteria bacterium]
MDTNILARYYIQDRADTEASKQHEAARKLIEAGDPLMVCKTVLLEFEWVMRGYYGFEREEILPVFRHLSPLAHIRIEDRSEVEQPATGRISSAGRATSRHARRAQVPTI